MMRNPRGVQARNMVVWLIVVLAALALGGWQYERYQKRVAAQAIEAVDDLTRRWHDAISVASATSRIALSGPVTNLQNLQREAVQLVVTPCLNQAKPFLVESMDDTVQGFLVFMRNEYQAESESNRYFSGAALQMDAYTTIRAACHA